MTTEELLRQCRASRDFIEAERRELAAWKANAQADIDAVAGKVVVADQRVQLLEGIIREARAMALAGEWDEPMIAKALGTVFACDVCMDTGVSGGMPKGDENDSCCHACHLGGNPMIAPKQSFPPGATVVYTLPKDAAPGQVWPREKTIVHDGSGVSRRLVPELPADAMVKLKDGRTVPNRFIDTDKEWP